MLLLPTAAAGSSTPTRQDPTAQPRPTLQALATSESPVVDGRLDEAAWRQAQPGSGFMQREPYDGQPASEETEVRVVYTPAVLYIAIKAYDSHPKALIAREMARDASVRRDDSVEILLDTFLDRRNAYSFATNPNGARSDSLITDEGRDVNREWDGVWAAAAEINDEGWQAEVAIPFSTLRYRPGLDTWGLQILRRIRRNSEEALWSPIPREVNIYRMSMAGDLTGLGGLKPRRQINIKPYLRGAREQDAEEGNSSDTEAGLDVKWGVTRNLALDLTYNTDFAEVEVDEQRVNLTRFPLFFPEKREFFLENSGIFEFGPRVSFRGRSSPLLKVFFSRRIGLDEDGEEVPIDYGARLTGRLSGWSVGALGVQSAPVDDIVERTGFGVLRLKRNLGERSNVGLIATLRDESGGETNRVFGIDADFNPTSKLNVNGFFTRSDTAAGEEGDEWALGSSAAYEGRALEYSLDYLEIGDLYQPEVGFLLRNDIRRTRPRLEYEPRIERWGIRNLRFGSEVEYISRLSDGIMETRNLELTFFGVRTFKDDGFNLDLEQNTERLFEPFEIQDGITIPAGRYDADPRWGLFAFTGDHRPLSVRLRMSDGGFFDGDRLRLSATLRFRPSRFFQGETGWSHNDVELPQGSFTTNVYRLRLALSLTTVHRIDSLVQFNDDGKAAGVNLRYNWIYRPGADLFVVYNQTWDAPSLDALTTARRELILKFSYLFQR